MYLQLHTSLITNYFDAMLTVLSFQDLCCSLNFDLCPDMPCFILVSAGILILILIIVDS